MRRALVCVDHDVPVYAENLLEALAHEAAAHVGARLMAPIWHGEGPPEEGYVLDPERAVTS